nr:hypothetical protein Iba_chr10eCG15430 [Ipomoea batatas]
MSAVLEAEVTWYCPERVLWHGNAWSPGGSRLTNAARSSPRIAVGGSMRAVDMKAAQGGAGRWSGWPALRTSQLMRYDVGRRRWDRSVQLLRDSDTEVLMVSEVGMLPVSVQSMRDKEFDYWRCKTLSLCGCAFVHGVTNLSGGRDQGRKIRSAAEWEIIDLSQSVIESEKSVADMDSSKSDAIRSFAN